jgi:hypothetical protein
MGSLYDLIILSGSENAHKKLFRLFYQLYSKCQHLHVPQLIHNNIYIYIYIYIVPLYIKIVSVELLGNKFSILYLI